jgi:hypothetical protein
MAKQVLCMHTYVGEWEEYKVIGDRVDPVKSK